MNKTKLITSLVVSVTCFSVVMSTPTLAFEINKGKEKIELISLKTGDTKPDINEKANVKTELKKANALKEIDRRVESLNKLLSKVSQMKRLEATQLATLTGQIKLEIDKLTNLRETIVSDSDKTTLALHKKSIIDSYRIYALFLPKITIIAHADQIIQTGNLMESKISDKSSEAFKNVEIAISKAKEAIILVVELVPEDYPAKKSLLSEAKTLLKDAIKSLNLARPLLNK